MTTAKTIEVEREEFEARRTALLKTALAPHVQ